MFDEDIEKVDKWFEKNADNYSTSHVEDEYVIGEDKLESFTDFLREEMPDLVGIPCYFGKGDVSIWFFKRDLERAEYY
jgi:hypothetical protein